MPLSDSSVPARKTIPRPDNLREEANSSNQREGDRNRPYTNTRTPSAASGYSSTHRRGVDRDSSSSYGTAAVVQMVPKPRRMLSAPLGRGYTGEQYLPPVVRSQGPVVSQLLNPKGLSCLRYTLLSAILWFCSRQANENVAILPCL